MRQVFISYSHDDEEWLDRLVLYLLLHEKKSQDISEIEFWSDRNIPSGKRWEGQIRAALMQVSAAVLLVSDHFRKSKYIQDNELPTLLELAKNKGIPLLWIAIDDGPENEEIRNFKALNNPEKPLIKLEPDHRRREFEQMAREIYNAVSRQEKGKGPSENRLSESFGLRLEVPSTQRFRKTNSDAFPVLKAHLDSKDVKKVTLIQMSCINERQMIQELWSTRTKVELFLSSGSDKCGVSDYQKERIEQFLDDLQNDLFPIPGRQESGELSIYKYAAPASVRAIVMDKDILTFGPYLYMVRTVRSRDEILDVRGRELPLVLLRRGDPDFEMIWKMIDELTNNWKLKGVAKHVVTLRHSDRSKPHRDLIELWRRETQADLLPEPHEE